MTARKLLENIEADMLLTLINHSKPNNRILGLESLGLSVWGYGMVLDLMGSSIIDVVTKVLNDEFGKPFEYILDSDKKDFVSFLSYIQKEFLKASDLLNSLGNKKSSKGISKMAKYGVISTYYAIDPNPLSWDALSKVPFVTMFVKLSIDETVAEIREAELKKMK